MSRSRNPYLKLEAEIATGQRGDAIRRWRYGRLLLKEKAGRQQLPHGLAATLIADAARAGYKLSEREIRYRLACAEVYRFEAEVGTAVQTFGSWTALRDAGFPPVEGADSEPTDALEEVGLTEPGHTQDPLFEIPGFKSVLKIRGAKVDLAAATVRQAVDYLEQCREMHASFGRTLEHMTESVAAMERGADGDLDANALDAYRRAVES